MLIGRLIDNVWATRKAESLNGLKFMMAELTGGQHQNERLVVADLIGAGIGERVLIVCGSSARKMVGDDTIPVDAAVIGIIDEDCPCDS
ncbi:EutN/CcmL family microcompartment protein [Dysosmobacter sp.]|uniref:EutN/CcmL family microcompartment protein n=1 Tax=Dysosmobacter sp. TaxID=2591382 RepID=UPI003AB3DDA0